jgi:hypothetical protein
VTLPLLSNEADKKHPWAKFKATPSTPRPPAPRPTAFTALKAVARTPTAPTTLPPVAPPPGAAPNVSFPKPRAIAPVALPARPAAAATPAKAAPAETPRNDWAAPRRVEKAETAPFDPQDRTVPPFGISEELAQAFTQVAAADAELTAKKKRGAGAKGFWLWRAAPDSAEDLNLRRRFVAWWRDWRKTPSFKVLAAFVILYAALAVVRRPSATMLEETRHAEELTTLQSFLKSYTGAGGAVMAEKPHGGAELYPRGILLQGEMLEAFRRAAVGESFSMTVREPMWNPVASFYGYPPVFAGGVYFQLERKFNLTLYRFTYLVRKDTEKTGTILLAKAELAF